MRIIRDKNVSIPFIIVLFVCIMSETYSLSTVYNLYPSGVFIIICGIMGMIGFFMFLTHLGVIYQYFKSLFILGILFIIYCFINIEINDVTFGEIYIFLKDIMYMLFAVWFLFFKLESEELLSLKSIMEKFFYIQIPMIIFQYIYYNFILKMSSVPGVEDLPVALLGKQMTGHIGILTVFIGIDLLEKYYESHDKKELVKVIVLFVLQFVMAVKVAIIFWVIAVLYVFRKKIIKINIRNTSIALILVSIFLIASKFLNNVNVLTSNYIKFTQNQIINFQLGYENIRLGRLTSIIIILKYLDNTQTGILLGNGIGTTKAAYQFNIYGRYYDIFTLPQFIGLLDNSFNFLYYEVGIIGLLIIILYLLGFTPKKSKKLRIKIFIFCSLIFYTHSLDCNFLTVYMSILLTISLKEKYEEKNLIKLQNKT